MGESSKWRSIYNQYGLRRRYMDLLVPALARVHADHPHGSEQLERAQAVRRAADTCLVQALTTANACSDHPHQRVREEYHTCVPYVSSAASRPSVLKLRKVAAARRGSSSCRLQALIIRGKEKSKANRTNGNSLRLKAARSCSIRKRAARVAKNCRSCKKSRRNRGAEEQGADMEESIPGESELRRLQSVLFPSKKKSTDNIAGDDLEHNNSSVANPAALLSQAAHYIIALQVQVEALRCLASLSVD